MPDWLTRRGIRPATTCRPRRCRGRRTAFNRLLAESLEPRLLLAAVTGVNPPANTHSASVATDITATFDQDINAATATTDSLSVHSTQQGKLVGGAAAVTASGATVNLDPASDFFPGQLVQATVTSAIQDAGGQPAEPFVWQFRTGVTSGGGLLSDSGQGLGDHESLAVALGDLDGDGDLDAYVAVRDGGNRIWINDGGTFTDSGQSLGDHNSFGVALGDLDGDGDLDAFVANLGSGNRVWINEGAVFTDSGQSLSNLNSIAVALGDLDGDGDLDAFVANVLQGNRVWLNDNGQFTVRQSLGNFSSNGVALGDLDGDGDLDAFVANSFQPNRVWLNDAGTFSDSGQSMGARRSRDVALGDLDGDGDLDAFVANGYDGNRVWLNDAGVFTDSGQSLGNDRSYGVALGDLDADGDLDAFVANSGDGNRLWLNSTATFTDSGQQLGGAYSAGAALGDLDGDGDLDAFVANQTQDRVWVNLNPTFSVSPVRQAGPEGNAGTSVFRFEVRRAFDTRGTASVDFAFAPSGGDPAELDDFAGAALPNGTLNFADGVASLPVTIEVVGDTDVENDEGFTLTISNPVGVNVVIGVATAVGLIRNDDSIDLGDLPSPFPTRLEDDGAAHIAIGPTLGAARDSEADGAPSASADGDDLAGAVNDEDGVTFGASLFAGQLGAEVVVTASAAAQLDGWIDFNGDHSLSGAGEQIFRSLSVPAGSSVLTFPVPAAARQGTTFARFRLSTAGGLAPTGGAADGEVEDHSLVIGSPLGNGVFEDSGQALGNHDSLAVALGDLDGDGDLDAFVAHSNQTGDRVWLNSNGTFSDSGQALGDHDSTHVALGDLDGDGDLDAFVTGGSQSGNRVWWNDAGNFTDSGQSLGSGSSYGAGLGDLDGDGDLDAFVANSRQGNRVWWNEGGAFSDSGQSLGNHDSLSVALGDLDGDGDLDAFVANYRQGNRVWSNEGGRFSDSGQALGDRASWSAALGDLDGDGDLDAFAANGMLDGDRVWLNSGGVFSDSGQALGNDASFDVALADLDGDGDTDAFVGGAGNRVWLNDGGQFVDHGQLLGTETSFGVALGDLDADGDLDAFAANYAAQGDRVWLNLANTTLVAISAGDARQDETNSGTVPFTFEVSRSGDVSGPSTVNYAVTGSGISPADAADFGGTLAGVVNFAAAETSRIITVNVSGDTLAEPDESFTVRLSDPTPATTRILTESARGTILNDDELPPSVSFSVDNAFLAEAEAVATVTATLSAATTVDVTVFLGFTGTATPAVDFTASANQIVIPAGSVSGTATITAVQDSLDETDEIITLDIVAVANAAEAPSQQLVIRILDDDQPGMNLIVTSLVPTSSGFIAELNHELDLSTLNLVDTESAGLGPADVLLEGASTGAVPGSLVIGTSPAMLTFIKSGGPLEADTYTVTLRSAADGLHTSAGFPLDGDGDGTPGDNFSATFPVAPPAANAVTVGVPDFVRGPGQVIQLPADSTDGIPITLSEAVGVRSVGLRVDYDPALLNITGATIGSMMPAGATVTVDTTTPGSAVVTFSSPSDLPAGSHVLVHLQAGVPVALANANYNSNHVLDLHTVTVTGAGGNSLPVVADDALHLVTYFGDVSANGRINATDAALVARVAASSDNGFSGSPWVDPLLVGDVSGNGRLNALDASLVAQVAALIPVPVIPPIPDVVIMTNAAAARPGAPRMPTAAVGEDRPAASPDRNADPYSAGWLSTADLNAYFAPDPVHDQSTAISQRIDADIEQLSSDLAEWPDSDAFDQALTELFR